MAFSSWRPWLRRRCGIAMLLPVVAAGCGTSGSADRPGARGSPPPSIHATGEHAASEPDEPDDGSVFHPAGIALRVPSGWERRTGSAVATEFAAAAECRTAVVVDSEPPPHPSGAGGGTEATAQQQQSLVQVCARPSEGQELEDFLRGAYGGLDGLERTELGGRTVYRTVSGALTILFAQLDGCRIQLASAVAAEPGLEVQRREEAAAALASVRFVDPTGGCS